MQLFENIFDVRFSYKSLLMLSLLAIFPNLLGMVILPMPFGIGHFHLFQILIFLAALIYGKYGGAVSGAFGSICIALLLNNPFIIIGNVILGFFTGVFAKRIHIVPAVLGAYAIQVPWLYFTDLLVGMPEAAVLQVIFALLISNVVWAVVAALLYKRIKKAIA